MLMKQSKLPQDVQIAQALQNHLALALRSPHIITTTKALKNKPKYLNPTSGFLVKKNEIKKLKKVISPIFQGSGPFGTITRQEEIKTLKNATIESFALNNIVATGNSGIIVITYDFSYVGNRTY